MSLDEPAPHTGGKVVLDLEDGDADGARYRALLMTPEVRSVGFVRVVGPDGAVEFTPWTPSAPPEWLLAYAKAFLRTAWRDRLDDGWPARINRWRPAK